MNAAILLVAVSALSLSSTNPLVVSSGRDSHIEQPSLEVIVSPERWNTVWAKHLGTHPEDAYRAAMEIDFDRCMVVAIFRGARTNVRGVRIESVSEVDDTIRIRADDETYQTAGESNNKPPDRPYAFVVLMKSEKTVIVEENVRRLLVDPPEWKEWMRSPGPASNK